MRNESLRKTVSHTVTSSVFVILISCMGCEEDNTPVVSTDDDNVVFGSALTDGLDLGVNTSEGLTDWVSVDSGAIKMSYPTGQSWGAVFVTVGEPTDPPRPGRDYSDYTRLTLDMRGQNGSEFVWIGIKDNTDLDNGKEIRVRVYGITTDWENYELPLSQFYTADFDSVYVPIEFVFDGGPKTIYARNIEYRR